MTSKINVRSSRKVFAFLSSTINVWLIFQTFISTVDLIKCPKIMSKKRDEKWNQRKRSWRKTDGKLTELVALAMSFVVLLNLANVMATASALVMGYLDQIDQSVVCYNHPNFVVESLAHVDLPVNFDCMTSFFVDGTSIYSPADRYLNRAHQSFEGNYQFKFILFSIFICVSKILKK